MGADLISSYGGAVMILVGLAIWGIVHSLLAADRAKHWASERLGPGLGRAYRLLYNAFSVVSLLPILAVPVLAPGPLLYAIPPGWRPVTYALQVVALAFLAGGLLQTDVLRFVGLRQLGAPVLPPAPFVASGLYRWVRHPLYSAGLLFIWLVPVMTASLLALNIGLTLYIVIGSVFEERKLVSLYGDPYRRYQQRVPRLIPRPWPPRQDPGGASPALPGS